MNTIVVNGEKVTPSKIVCVGRNYAEHISELGNEIPTDMVIFTKPNSAISSELNSFSGEPLHYEGEICFVYQSGELSSVGFGLDLTKRNLQSSLKNKGLPWERAKAFNGSALFSEFLSFKVTEGLSILLHINNEKRQEGNVDLMMFKPKEILEGIELFMKLEDGDVVMTGTPKGVGAIVSGDHFVGSIFSDGEYLTGATWTAS